MTNTQGNKKVVVLNDTSGRQHHGCARVMRVLRDGLSGAGLQVTATSPARHDWANDPGFQAHMAQADLIVINGEGTMHHARPAGEILLRVVDNADARGTPVALINALYQDNPPQWSAYLRKMALIATRDERSGADIQHAAPQVPLRVMPDLSLCAPVDCLDQARKQVVFGDSVKLDQRRALLKAAARCGADKVVPMKTREGVLWRFRPSRAMLYGLYSGHLGRAAFHAHLAQDEAQYLRWIAEAKMHVTGRFHSVCLSLLTETPVLALGSNSWKIAALLEEAGLDGDRLLTPGQLARMGPADMDRPFSETERAGIDAFLTQARAAGSALFSDLAKLASDGRA